MTEDMEKRVEEIRRKPIDYFTEDAEKIKDLFSAIDTLKEENKNLSKLDEMGKKAKMITDAVSITELEAENKELKDRLDKLWVKYRHDKSVVQNEMDALVDKAEAKLKEVEEEIVYAMKAETPDGTICLLEMILKSIRGDQDE